MLAQPLASPRLELLPFGERHFTARYVGWLNGPDVVRFSEQRHRNHTLDGCRAWIAAMQAAGDPVWAIELDGRHIGNIAAYFDAINSVADVSMLIGELDLWGRGLGLEAWQAVCDFLMREGVRKITGGTMACNTGMVKVMQRSGMEPDGIRRGQFLLDGAPMDAVYFARMAKI